MKFLSLILFLLCVQLKVTGQRIPRDTSAVAQRSFSEQAIRELKNNSEFQYDKLMEPPASLWERFWTWFWMRVADLMSTQTGRATVYTVFIVLGVAVLAFFIYKVMQANKVSLFARNSNEHLSFSIDSDNIHQIDFDSAIEAAIQRKNYRMAIRLLYLQSLKKLSDRQLINWQVNKTNTDYVREVSAKPWQPLFRRITNHFEFAWYGEMQVGEEKFRAVKDDFNNLYNQF